MFSRGFFLIVIETCHILVKGKKVHACYSVGMMIESMANKAAAWYGECYDATPFQFSEDDPAADYFGNLLVKGKLFHANFKHSSLPKKTKKH